jgi:hypothetical protein
MTIAFRSSGTSLSRLLVARHGRRGGPREVVVQHLPEWLCCDGSASRDVDYTLDARQLKASLPPRPTARPSMPASSEADTVQPSNRFSKTAAAPRARFLRPK